jgi:hypothetical protein
MELPLIIIITVFGYSAAIILGYVYYYQKKYAQKPRARRVTIKTLLDNVAEGKESQFIEKQQKTMEIITETKKKISEQTASIPEQMSKKLLAMDSAQEAQLIKEGAKLLKQFAPAEPISEEQRKTDMDELLKAASKLQEMETDTPIQDVDELYSNVGYGLWMDTIAQGLRKITADPNIRKHGMLQIEKLMSFLPRSFDPKDIRNALQLMKKSKEVVDLVELNPKTFVIGFTQESTELKTAEKVLLAAIASEDEMTKQKVKMLFNWEDDFLNEVSARLTALNILQIKGDKLVAEGLLTAKDREYIKQKEAAKRVSMAMAAPGAQGSSTARPAAAPAPVRAAPKPVVNLPAVKVPPVPYVQGVPSKPSTPQQPAKPAAPPVPGFPAQPAAKPGGIPKPWAAPAIPKVASLPPNIKVTPGSAPAAAIPAVKALPATKPIPPKIPAVPASAAKPVPASGIAPAVPSVPHAKPTPPALSLKKPSVPPLPAKPKPVPTLPKPAPVQPEQGEEGAAEASKPAKYVQIGDITPVNEAQRHDDMDDIMTAVMQLEKESSFSEGKEKPNLQVYDKDGKAVDNEGLLSQGKISKHVAPEPAISDVEALAEKILAVYEKQEIVNGGVMQLKKLSSLLGEEAGSKINENKLASTLEVVKSMGMISNIIDLQGGDKLILFKEIELAADEIGIIQLAISTPIAEFTKQSIVKLLGVPEEIVLATLKKLQEKGIIRFSGNSVQVPGVIQ